MLTVFIWIVTALALAFCSVYLLLLLNYLALRFSGYVVVVGKQ